MVADVADEDFDALEGGLSHLQFFHLRTLTGDGEACQDIGELTGARIEDELPGVAVAPAVEIKIFSEFREIEAHDVKHRRGGGLRAGVGWELAGTSAAAAQEDAFRVDDHELIFGFRVGEAEAALGREPHVAGEHDGDFFKREKTIFGERGGDVAVGGERGGEFFPGSVVFTDDDAIGGRDEVGGVGGARGGG